MANRRSASTAGDRRFGGCGDSVPVLLEARPDVVHRVATELLARCPGELRDRKPSLAALEFDEAKRIKIYQKLIDQVNRKNYILPVADLPMVFVHAKDVRVVDDPLSPITTEVRDYAWSN